MQSVEKDYVLVNSHFASLEAFSDYFDSSLQDDSLYSISLSHSNITNLDVGVAKKAKDLTSSSSRGLENLKNNELETCEASFEFTPSRNEHEISSLHSLELLRQYVKILKELSQQKVSLCSVNERLCFFFS